VIEKDYMLYVGADVSRRNWLTVALTEGNNWKVNLFKNLEQMWYLYKTARLILLDIPIGLREEGDKERICDIEARKLLSSRRSSVFRAPCRAATQAASYEDAKRVNRDRTSKSLSIQTWGINPKIREVDEFLINNIPVRSRIREIHPEVCFWALNGGKPMRFNKKGEKGFRERIRVLRQVCDHTDDIFKFGMHEYQGKVAVNDILDALVAAVTASKESQGLLTIPEKPEIDSKGLPMEMVYLLPMS